MVANECNDYVGRNDSSRKINVCHYIDEMEQVLRAASDPARCRYALSVLRRWQFDSMLDDASRQRAAALVREFESRTWFRARRN